VTVIIDATTVLSILSGESRNVSEYMAGDIVFTVGNSAGELIIPSGTSLSQNSGSKVKVKKTFDILR
jgi:hypothetical protein